MEPTCIGIDVSKDRLDVACHPAGEAFAVGRDAAGLDALVERLRPLAPQLVALEATGGYESVVSATLGAAGLPVVVVNPAQVRDFARALGRRAKTDPIDAAVIAHFAAATRPGLRPLPDAASEHLGALLARRRQIIAMVVAERQRQSRFAATRSPATERLQKSIARLLAALQKELCEVDRESTRPSATRRPGATGRRCWSRSRASGRSSPAPYWPRCPSSAGSTAARSQPWPASPPGPASRASGRDAASSAAAAPWCARRCSWAPSPPPATTLPTRRSANACWLPASPGSSP